MMRLWPLLFACSGGTTPMKDLGPLPADPCVAAGTCPPGQWINVTPAGLSAAVLRPTMNSYGPGSVVGDPAHPAELYVGGSSAGLWKSSDYGFTWTLVNDTLPDTPRGVVIAAADRTVWWAGYNEIHISSDGGASFTRTPQSMSLYSLRVDPNDARHLISGLHEADGIAESGDGGVTWKLVGGSNFPSGGVSWYPFFVDAGDPATTRRTWMAIAQNGASAISTTDQGASWTIPAGVAGLQHPHGNSQLFQSGANLFLAGTNGPDGQGVYRSGDRGATWARADDGQTPEAVVWGSRSTVYAMYAWACSNCDLGTQFESAPLPGTSWTRGTVPAELTIGPNSVAVTNDGTHDIFVAVMWDQGIWRYVEP